MLQQAVLVSDKCGFEPDSAINWKLLNSLNLKELLYGLKKIPHARLVQWFAQVMEEGQAMHTAPSKLQSIFKHPAVLG